jgi:hypothetical protein
VGTGGDIGGWNEVISGRREVLVLERVLVLDRRTRLFTEPILALLATERSVGWGWSTSSIAAKGRP